MTFLEGILSFISPCILPLLPVYLSYFAAAASTPGKKKHTVVVNALCFVAGFSLIFILMGALAGSFGALVNRYMVYIRLAFGLLLLLLGLNFAGWVVVPFLSRGKRGNFSTGKYGPKASFLMGIFFSMGWVPCVGAFLSAALMAAANSATLLRGMLLLTVYSLGLGLPLILCAALMNYLSQAVGFLKRNYNIINKISGIVLILLAIQMLYQSLSIIF